MKHSYNQPQTEILQLEALQAMCAISGAGLKMSSTVATQNQRPR